TDPTGALRGYDLSKDEFSAIRSGDPARLNALGVEQRMSKAFVLGSDATGHLGVSKAATSDLGAGTSGTVTDGAGAGTSGAVTGGADTLSNAAHITGGGAMNSPALDPGMEGTTGAVI